MVLQLLMNSMTKRLGPFFLTVRRALSFVWQSSPSLTLGNIVVRAPMSRSVSGKSNPF